MENEDNSSIVLFWKFRLKIMKVEKRGEYVDNEFVEYKPNDNKQILTFMRRLL